MTKLFFSLLIVVFFIIVIKITSNTDSNDQSKSLKPVPIGSGLKENLSILSQNTILSNSFFKSKVGELYNNITKLPKPNSSTSEAFSNIRSNFGNSTVTEQIIISKNDIGQGILPYIYIDTNNNLYIPNNNLILKYNTGGVSLGTITINLSSFNGAGTALDSQGNFIIADNIGRKIRKYDQFGNELFTDNKGNNVFPINISGLIFLVHVDSNDNIYINTVNSSNWKNILYKYTISTNNLTNIINNKDGISSLYNNNLYILNNNLISKYDTDGVLSGTININNSLFRSTLLTVDPQGNFIIADDGKKIRKYNQSGIELFTDNYGNIVFPINIPNPGNSVSNILIDSFGNMYIKDNKIGVIKYNFPQPTPDPSSDETNDDITAVLESSSLDDPESSKPALNIKDVVTQKPPQSVPSYSPESQPQPVFEVAKTTIDESSDQTNNETEENIFELAKTKMDQSSDETNNENEEIVLTVFDVLDSSQKNSNDPGLVDEQQPSDQIVEKILDESSSQTTSNDPYPSESNINIVDVITQKQSESQPQLSYSPESQPQLSYSPESQPEPPPVLGIKGPVEIVTGPIGGNTPVTTRPINKIVPKVVLNDFANNIPYYISKTYPEYVGKYTYFTVFGDGSFSLSNEKGTPVLITNSSRISSSVYKIK